jgi:ABC-type nitrate/sulfonate/bicarbonate transport system substrate-binding protein
MMSFRQSIPAIVALIAFTCAAESALAQRARLSYAGTAGFNMPFMVAHEAALYKKYGLRDELIFIPGAATTMQALLAGEIEFVNSSGSPAINSILQGADVSIIAVSYDAMPYSLIVNKEIRTPEDLKGKSMGVARLGGINEVGIRLALEKFRINPKEVTFVSTGADPTRIAAVQAGVTAATVLAPPASFQASSLGLKVLADLADLGLKYPTSVIATRRSYLSKDRPLLKKFMMAFLEGLALYKTDRNFVIKVMQKYTRLNDTAMLGKTHDYFVKNTAAIPLVDPNALPAGFPGGKNPDKPLSEFYDNSVLQELINEGFTKNLTKRTGN